jgi:hypothetical protein
MESVVDTTTNIIVDFWSSIVSFAPQLFAGLLLLILGLIFGNVTRRLILGLSSLITKSKIAGKIKLEKVVPTALWLEIIAEMVRWTVIILFLVAAVDAWGLSQVGSLLSELVLYLPNVFISVVIAFIGMVVSSLVADLVTQSAKDMGAKATGILSTLSRYTVIVFTILMILNQLGVAEDLVRILFSGIIAMLSLAGGLAFGLGGKDTAKKLLEEFYEKLRK